MQTVEETFLFSLYICNNRFKKKLKLINDFYLPHSRKQKTLFTGIMYSLGHITFNSN